MRYLVVYGREARAQSNLAHCKIDDRNPVLTWIYRHKWVAAMIAYFITLLIIGASNSRHGYYFRQFMHQATLDAIDYIKAMNLFGLNYIQKLFG